MYFLGLKHMKLYIFEYFECFVYFEIYTHLKTYFLPYGIARPPLNDLYNMHLWSFMIYAKHLYFFKECLRCLIICPSDLLTITRALNQSITWLQLSISTKLWVMLFLQHLTQTPSSFLIRHSQMKRSLVRVMSLYVVIKISERWREWEERDRTWNAESKKNRMLNTVLCSCL